jgi:hypothetical protein
MGIMVRPMKFTLYSGRVVSLSRLYKRLTYARPLAGKPNRQMNDALVGSFLEEAKAYAVPGAKPVVLLPAVAVLDAELPAVSGIGVFDSGPFNRSGREPFTSMAFIFWQKEFFPVFPPQVEQEIVATDWEANAQELTAAMRAGP